MTTQDLVTLSRISSRRVERILSGDFAALKLSEMEAIAGALQTPLYALLGPDEPDGTTDA